MSTPPAEILEVGVLTRMVDTLGVGVAVYNSDGEFLYVNSAYAEMLGTAPETLVGTPVWAVNPSFDPGRFEEYWHSFEDAESRFAEATHEYEGTEAHVSTVTTRITVDGTGYHIGTIRDVTRRKERERQLEQLHTVTRDLVEAETRQEIAEITADTAETILDYDIAVFRFVDGDLLRPVAVTGATSEHMGDRPAYPLDSDVPAVRAHRTGQSVTAANLSDIEDGRDRGNARSATFVPVGEYGVLGVAATVEGTFDQSDVYLASLLASKAETALDRLDRERDLERQKERFEAFYDVISHDIPNHLNVATSRLFLATEEVSSEHLDHVGSAHDRIQTVLEDMRTLVEQGKQAEETEWLLLSELVTDCWEGCRPEEGAARVDLDGDLRIEADRSRLRQLFENLFWNALDHAGPDVLLRVGRLDDGFYVEDDGPGIPPEDREEVLSPGYTTAEDHSGFGLAIVNEIARAHGWSLTISEGRDGGARFELTGAQVRDT